MKVIKKKDWSDWRIALVCSLCQSELEAEASDINAHAFSGDGPNRPGGFTYNCKCPICLHELPIDGNKVPAYLLRQAETQSRRRE